VSNDQVPGEETPNETPPHTHVEEDHDGGSRKKHRGEEFRHTRTSAAWVAITVAVLFGVALIDFIAQNTRDVRLEFFSARGHIPLSVALLAAALAGAIVVLAIGIGRVAQLRLTMRRQRRRSDATSAHRQENTATDGGPSDT
jgi:uncharacterized integral membrane protein